MFHAIRNLMLIALLAFPIMAHAIDVKKAIGQGTPVVPPLPAAITGAPAAVPEAPTPETQAVESSFAETLPIEVNLMYLKLSKKDPNFDFLVFADPTFRDKEQRYSDSDNIKKQRDALQALFDSFNKDTVFYAEKTINLDAYFANNNTIKLEGIEPYEPILYPVTPTDIYGIFIRNARDTLRLRPPFEYGAPSALMMIEAEKLKNLPVEMTLKPLVADVEPFYLEENKPIKVLVADIVEVKVYKDAEKTSLLLQKRFKNWKPVVPIVEDEKFKTDDLVQPATP